MLRVDVKCRKECISNRNGVCIILNDTTKYREHYQHCPFRKQKGEKK